MIEGKPKYTLVGFFAVLSILFVIITFYVATNLFRQRDFDTYYVMTKYSVPGLSNGSPVKYKGVDVGRVDHINIAKDQETIVIKISVKKNIDLKKDVVASLGITGITGLSYIDLEREKGVRSIFDKDLNDYVIPMKPSEIQQISEFIPNVLQSANNLINNLTKLTSDKSRKNLDKIFDKVNLTANNLNTLIEASKSSLSNTNNVLSAFNKKINELNVKNINDTIENYNTLAQKLNQETKDLDTLIKSLNKNSNNLSKLYPEISSTLDSIKDTSDQIKLLARHIKNHPDLLFRLNAQKPFPLEESK